MQMEPQLDQRFGIILRASGGFNTRQIGKSRVIANLLEQLLTY